VNKNKSYKRAVATATATQIRRAKGTRRIYIENDQSIYSIYNDRSETEYYVHRPVTDNNNKSSS